MRFPEHYLPDQKVTVVGRLSTDDRDRPFVGEVCVVIKRCKSGLYQIKSVHSDKVIGSFPKWMIEPVPDLIDYRSLFEQALHHLRAVSGSRNSFSYEARERLFSDTSPFTLRDAAVEKMHKEAVAFLKQHDN